MAFNEKFHQANNDDIINIAAAKFRGRLSPVIVGKKSQEPRPFEWLIIEKFHRANNDDIINITVVRLFEYGLQ